MPDSTALQAALDLIRDAAFITDLSGRVLYANRASRTVLDDPMTSADLAQLIRSVDLRSGRVSEQTRKADLLTAITVRDGVIGTATVRSEDNGMRVYHASATCIGSPPNEPLIVLVLEDVTAQRRTWEDLVLRDRAMAATAEGITISDRRLPDNPLIYVNAGFETITGYTRDEVLGRNCRFLQGPESNDGACAEIRSAIQENRSCVVELKNYRKDGSLFWNRLSITPIRDESGAVTHFIGIQSDITGRVESEARLHALTAELRRLNERLLHDLRAAAQIQRAQLPPARLEIPGIRVAWFFESCEALAGDMLNIVRLDSDTIAMYVLDVSGHGTGAALLSTSVSRLLQPDAGPASLVVDEIRPGQGRRAMNPAEVIDRLNKTYAWDPESNQFFTIVYALIHPERKLIRFTCAGHPSPIIVSRDGRHQTFRPDGLPVGVADEAYSEAHASLHAGDRVYLYSDGVVECMNDRAAIFGVARLIAILKENHGRNLDAAVQTVREALTLWRGDRSVHDDMTLLAIELV